MEKDRRTECYEPPQVEMIEIMVEQAMLSASSIDGYSDDSEGNYEFGW